MFGHSTVWSMNNSCNFYQPTKNIVISMYSVNAEPVAYDVFVQNILSVPDLFNDTSACPYTPYTYTWYMYHMQSSWSDIEI